MILVYISLAISMVTFVLLNIAAYFDTGETTLSDILGMFLLSMIPCLNVILLFYALRFAFENLRVSSTLEKIVIYKGRDNR